MSEYKRYTEKRNGKNVIPLRNAVCGVDLPKWSIEEHSDIQSFLSGDAVDRLAELEDKIEQGTLVELPDLACKFGVVEYCCQKKKPLKVVEYYPCCYEFSTKRIVLCWLCDNMNFRVVENGFDTREEAEKRLKELQK